MKLQLTSLYKKRIDDGFEFNVLLVGDLFKSTRNHLLFGCTDGRIILYRGDIITNDNINNNNNNNDTTITKITSCIEEVLESKGASIQSLCLSDITRFGGIDIVSGDSHGNLVAFSNHQIIYRDSIGEAISALTTHHSINGDFDIVVGDRSGMITAFKPFQSVQWKVRLPTVVELRRLSLQRGDTEESSTSVDHTSVATTLQSSSSQRIRDIVSYRTVDSYNVECSYTVVSDNTNAIHFIDRGNRVNTIETPAPINCICSGYFDDDQQQQLALGSENGYIYLVGSDMKLRTYCNVGYPITKLYRYQSKSINTKHQHHNGNGNGHGISNGNGVNNKCSNNDDVGLDCLLCIGHFHSLKVYYNKDLICEHIADDWIHTLSIGDVMNRGEEVIVIGKLNNSIEYLKPTVTH
ncbi:hypothetical protein SAMD00019534_073930 [Acytostelium subglobosum LB1]|uniref:hypothetical protein n=1 Tax=Acytostelium subglobosum LB1 TaxID=1410327 RepID=UPI0006447D39|nr:hypothetical protein SAMD00019534_073930 [Acytostelium subglobosum LB1]GAM24218.1 hypothetical protein SAMD00019534_073930 [Acytostelium subglobosum LB1]|eukprot:XP_012752544.1 hypothetical protein SAMD00019534_073930 [Acytostelium subglobosum LB1]